MSQNNTIQRNYISKEDSTILYGIAILMMVFHHCFVLPERLNYDYIPCIFRFGIEAGLANLGKLCVGIYAFITGYALSKRSNPGANTGSYFVNNVKVAVSSLVKFYSKFWLVCIIFLPIGIIFFDKSRSILSLIRAFVLGQGYNGEWWYVFHYIRFLVIFPFLDTFVFSYKHNRRQFTLFAFLAILLLAASVVLFQGHGILSKIFRQFYKLNAPAFEYTCVFILAYLIGKFGFFEKLSEKKHISSIVSIIVILLLLVFRWFMVVDPKDGRWDIIITPILVFCLVQLIHAFHSISVVTNTLKVFGKYSTFMWLIHTFWIYYYFQKIILLPRYSILIYLWAVLISLMNAMLLNFLYDRCELGKAANKISAWVMALECRKPVKNP